ncbi:hypothetical protein L6164_026077 [Bauhinia variegata]|uniref:Uncharacterized protein n=1 Tax=Bauhinia variegata TaxID=167791 RepID=A0ACB9M6G2_BAUVA|nr:hypothetical protein L6164_026077 [Bauhinia variegata]
MANEKSRILIFGGTGYIGKYMIKASIALGHPTFIYSCPLNAEISLSKLQLCQEFTSMGTNFIHGELEYDQIVAAIKKVDIVISTLTYPQVLDQLKIIDAIKVAGNIKRFLPSEFGSKGDTIKPLPPFQAFLDKKISIGRATEEAGIPYTYVPANCYAAYFVYLCRRRAPRSAVSSINRIPLKKRIAMKMTNLIDRISMAIITATVGAVRRIMMKLAQVVSV